MMKPIAIILATTLGACVDATPIRSPSGGRGFIVRGSTRSMAIEKSAEVCNGPYETQDPIYAEGVWNITVYCQ